MTNEDQTLLSGGVTGSAGESVAPVRNESKLEYSRLDSERFGLRVFRAHDSALGRELAVAIAENECDVAIVRVRAESALSSLSGVPGFEVRHADTLVYYDCDPERVNSKLTTPAVMEVRSAEWRDEPALIALVERAFTNYPSHYVTNELFRPELVLAGYMQWASNFIDSPNREVLLAQEGDRLVGFLTYVTRDDAIEIVLNGVDPEWRGRGVYGGLLRSALARARQAGVHHVEVSTQINNYTVQRAWQREGFKLSAAFQTYHVNSMLHAGDEVAVLQLHLTNGNFDENVSSVLKGLQVQAPTLVADFSRIEITNLVLPIDQDEYGVRVRVHVSKSGVRRYSGVIRDSLGRVAGVLSAESNNGKRKESA